MGQEVPLSLCFDEDDFGKGTSRRTRAPAELFFHEPWEPPAAGDGRSRDLQQMNYPPWETSRGQPDQANGYPQPQKNGYQNGHPPAQPNGYNQQPPRNPQKGTPDSQRKQADAKVPWEMPRSGFAAPWEKTFKPDAGTKTQIPPESPGGSGSKDSEGDLPPDWRDAKDPKSGRTYFWNVRTRERQWHRPEFKKSTASSAKKTPARSPASKSQGSSTPMSRRSAPSPTFDNNGLDDSPNKGDTVIIKKGFVATLQRGIVQHGDNGFQVNMQTGFKAPKKQEEEVEEEEEEVIPEPEPVPLGPIPASQYRAQPGDKIDEYVEWYCHQLEPSRGATLIMNKIQDEGEGAYEIAGRFVRINWTQGQNGPDLIVREAGEADVQQLARYLRQAADVAFELSKGASAINQVPKHLRMSMDVDPNKPVQDRFEAMRLARNEAELREKAAQTWASQQASSGLSAPNILRQSSVTISQPTIEWPGHGPGASSHGSSASPYIGGGRTVR